MENPDISLLAPVTAEYAPLGRTALLPALHAAQAIYGWLPQEVAAEIAAALGVPLVEVFGVIEFYKLFYPRPVRKTVDIICTDPVCAMAGAQEAYNVIARHYKPGALDVTVQRSPCLGLCEHAPTALVQEKQFGELHPRMDGALTDDIGLTPFGVPGGDLRLLTALCGKNRPTSLVEYRANGGYEALVKAFARPPEDLIAEVKASGLVGRGGAAFPTGAKWEGAYRANGQPKYVVCNGEEAEPGAFKDRVLMEEDPHRIIEGLAITAHAIGASKGYIFIRGEYPRAYQVMRAAVEEARSIFPVEIEVRRGAGAYICGEETALFEAIEGKRGFPRIKPPFPTTAGLFGKPTVISNVETLANIPLIITLGADGYRRYGTEKSPGPKLFCVSGDVMKPGLYEVPFGITLRHLIEDLAGGMRDGKGLQCVLMDGAAGAFASPDQLDVRLSFEDLRAAGLPLGSGVVTVLNETRDLRDVLVRLARFFADESCGKCTPCRIGTRRQYEILERLAAGQRRPGDLELLQDIGWTMTDASLCGLGQTAATALISALRLWPVLFSPTDGKEP